MTKDQERKLVDAWLKGRKWVRCETCDHIVTVGQEAFTVFAKPGGKFVVECKPCKEDHDADV